MNEKQLGAYAVIDEGDSGPQKTAAVGKYIAGEGKGEMIEGEGGEVIEGE